jgi:hypothetical protein
MFGLLIFTCLIVAAHAGAMDGPPYRPLGSIQSEIVSLKVEIRDENDRARRSERLLQLARLYSEEAACLLVSVGRGDDWAASKWRAIKLFRQVQVVSPDLAEREGVAALLARELDDPPPPDSTPRRVGSNGENIARTLFTFEGVSSALDHGSEALGALGTGACELAPETCSRAVQNASARGTAHATDLLAESYADGTVRSEVPAISASDTNHAGRVPADGHPYISGRVRYPSGAPCRGCDVSAAMQSGGVTDHALTDDDGRFRIPVRGGAVAMVFLRGAQAWQGGPVACAPVCEVPTITVP